MKYKITIMLENEAELKHIVNRITMNPNHKITTEESPSNKSITQKEHAQPHSKQFWRQTK